MMIFLAEMIVSLVSTCAEDLVVRQIHFQAGVTQSFFSFTGKGIHQTVIAKLKANIQVGNFTLISNFSRRSATQW